MNNHIPQGLQAKADTLSMAFSSHPISTSHFLAPCIFHRINLSLPPRRDTRTTRSLSGQQADGSRRHGDESRKTASDANASCSMFPPLIVGEAVRRTNKGLPLIQLDVFLAPNVSKLVDPSNFELLMSTWYNNLVTDLQSQNHYYIKSFCNAICPSVSRLCVFPSHRSRPPSWRALLHSSMPSTINLSQTLHQLLMSLFSPWFSWM